MKKKKRVLVVDDDPELLNLISQLFEAAGAVVTGVSGGSEALKLTMGERAKKAPFDLIVVDVMMPGMNGDELALTLKQNGCVSPIVSFTAAASMQSRKKCLEAGIDAYLGKETLKVELIEALLVTYCR